MITIETRMVGNHAAITISDNGCGISIEDQLHIFTPFFTTKDRATNGHKSLGDTSGTGLGLFMCHNTVQSLGGEIAVQSRPGEGAAFHVTLPLVTQEEPYEPR